MDASPTARALRTLDLIHQRPGIRAVELADRLGVTERAVRRYVGTLRDAGIPVSATTGRYGGYRIGRGVRLPPVVFSGPEALAVVMAVLDSPAGAPAPDSLAGSGVAKLLRALPESVGRPAGQFWQHIAAAPSLAPRPEVGIASALVEAVASARRVRISYRSAAGHEWTSEVDPWAVVVRYGLWYLLCRIPSGELRTYRLDRIGAAELLTAASEVPADLDAVAVLERSLGEGWELSTRVRFRAPAEQVRPWLRAPMGRLEPDGDECVLTGTTSNPQMYAGEWLAQVPFPFRVEEGPELRAAVAELADRLRAAVQ
ncbi:MAG: WYL domain-containing protein [Micropruina sp.]|uniref:helix-turn-helix transcriptional regulator n=1 Tax=Micropruina sp. TaxID=2737536 RepID=UPI0039E4C3C8